MKTHMVLILLALLWGSFAAIAQTLPTDTPPDALRIEFDQPILFGEGWGGVESSEGVTFQWTTRTHTSLHVQLEPNQTYVIRFGVRYGITDAILNSLAFRVNDTPIALRHVQDEALPYTYEAVVPSVVINRHLLDTTLEFVTRDTTSPKALGMSQDARQLGIALDWLTIEKWSPDTESPETTIVPALTEIPESTTVPEITETPELTETPEVTAVPELTEESEPTETSGSTAASGN